jgi:ribosomal protein S18 acetylase RimI-like enzyme
MQLELTLREMEIDDFSDLDWAGGAEHVRAVADAFQACFSGEVAMAVISLPNGRLIAHGAVDFRRSAAVGDIWMLAVHEAMQGMGVGTALIAGLEQRVRDRGLGTARLGVEHDNLRAARLYRRLGYREVGSVLEGWPLAGGRTYLTVCTLMEHDLTTAAH